MKIVITGHNRGLGRSLSRVFSNEENNIVGFNKSAGCDISLDTGRQAILKELEDADVFINNAYDPVGQTKLLQAAVELWNGTNKFIINIGSKCTSSFINTVENPFVRDFIDVYTLAKQEQEQLIKSRLRGSFPRILNVIPGVIDTEMASIIQSKKLNPDDIASLIYQMFLLKDKIAVQELTIDVPDADWDQLKFLI
jgi:NAD(P)-dependent dehydrogenase (short-subunit alcohol dehydrogenase family)